MNGLKKACTIILNIYSIIISVVLTLIVIATIGESTKINSGFVLWILVPLVIVVLGFIGAMLILGLLNTLAIFKWKDSIAMNIVLDILISILEAISLLMLLATVSTDIAILMIILSGVILLCTWVLNIIAIVNIKK